MKILHKVLALCLPLMLLVGCASTAKKTDTAKATEKPAAEAKATDEDVAFDEDEDAPELVFVHSKHLALPDTSSKIVTKPQEMHLDMTAVELTKRMGNGINLGNTMEAYGRSKYGPNKSIDLYETFWGQPITTQEMMNGYKKAGLDSVRIPVAWTNGIAFETGDYTLNTALLDRVETIVNYALKAGLIVVFNDHWDGSWWGMFGSATPEVRADAMDLYVAMWTQIANRFKNYSDYVIFEGGNEELGDRFNDKDVAKDSGTLSYDECYETSLKVNQAFVDTVRKTGGNNANRFLLIPGFGTDIKKTLDDRFKMPTDTAKNKLILSVHYYEPWAFCGGPSCNHWGTTSEFGIQNSTLGSLSGYVENGYGIIIGEYGVGARKDGSKKKDMCTWLSNVLDNCDYYGYCPMLWDCNGFFKKDSASFPDPEVAAVYKGRDYASQSKLSTEQIMTDADNRIQDRFDNSPEMLSDNPFVGKTDVSVAWIMYNSKDWTVTYSVGDKYNPDSYTDGIKATDVQITGPGTYTVGLDFTGIDGGFSSSFAFSAIGISNGEKLFPGYIMTIKEVKVNGVPYANTKPSYTASDDKICTRTNIYNEWVKTPPVEARVATGANKDKATASIVDNNDKFFDNMKTLTITFDYGPAK